MRIPGIDQITRTGEAVAGIAFDQLKAILGQVSRLVGAGSHDDHDGGEEKPAPPVAASPTVAVKPAVPTPVRPARAAGTQAVAESLPSLQEEDVLVASSADAGARNGAGPTIRVDEPWAGYRAMTAPDIVDRLVVSDAATVAAVKLYEASHRKRRSVLAQADLALAAASN